MPGIMPKTPLRTLPQTSGNPSFYQEIISLQSSEKNQIAEEEKAPFILLYPAKDHQLALTPLRKKAIINFLSAKCLAKCIQ
jgi:hypothetical protein